MPRITADGLRQATLARQFPDLPGRDGATVLDLFARLGPIQSQVPRAPFLVASSRLPGVEHSTLVELFASFRLLRASNLRGTVHTAVREQFGWLDAVARRGHGQRAAAALRLTRTRLDELTAELEAYASEEWRPRADLVAHGRTWLAGREPALPAADDQTDSMIWGHSGLLRRPADQRWATRTDRWHRTARSVAPELAPGGFAESLTALVRAHLGAYGPATREDLAFFLGVRLGPVEEALATLGDAVVRLTGPGTQTYLDLAEPPTPTRVDPGLRLLGEFDGLLLGFAGPNRTRFCAADQLPRIWAKANGQFAPTVLDDGRLVATWKTVSRGQRTDVEVMMLPGEPPLADDRFVDQLSAVSTALDLPVTELRVLPGC